MIAIDDIIPLFSKEYIEIQTLNTHEHLFVEELLIDETKTLSSNTKIWFATPPRSHKRSLMENI